ncbi:restriction endonuclease subunit S [Variovorax sp. PAMC28562]|uniref:restriction endonuclease subunit S n=1 Tax=Variovorax sp. PAMC28562 TaxID=2762323 RepID=UPI00164E4979|nr:restriction endonuclease subunit S [Variovorax sp. PAMC28562]QNK74539.1 restriction endonuclease subunit S [Variovorax sp. PAMC28562]
MTHESDFASLGEVADESVAQTGPATKADFAYVDIGSIDRERKTIATAQAVSVDAAPSRAKQRLRSGDVLVSMTRPNLNAVAIVPASLDGAIGSTGFHVLRSKYMVPQYLYFLVQSQQFVDAMCAVVQGALYPAVRPSDINAFVIRAPSLAEQTRIVDKLEELLSDLDAGVAELKAAQKKLAQYRQSLLKAAVEGRLTEAWRAQHGPETDSEESGAQLLARILRERRARWEAKQLTKFKAQGKAPPKGWQDKYEEPAAPSITGQYAIPMGWTWATVDQLSVEQKYGSSAKTAETDSGVPVIRMGNIQDGDLDLNKLKYLPTAHDEFPALFLVDGDMLFNRTNSPELVGKSAVYRSQISPCSYASYLIAVRFSPSVIPELVAGYINSGFGRQWVKSVVTQQVGQANVNGTKLAALTMPLPPFEEQVEIARVLSEQQMLAAEQSVNVAYALRQSAAQRKNILQSAFSGQLVPQDPNDEPASVLLARIRAERGAQSQAGGAGRRQRRVASE